MTIAEMQRPSLKLNTAFIVGARKQFSLKPKRHGYSRGFHRASVHPVTSACRIFRVADDAVVVTDGSYGYIPFSLSGLKALLAEAETLPISTEFLTDK